MTREDINDIINAICPNDEDYEKPCISPKYLRQELEQLALDQEQWNGEPTPKDNLGVDAISRADAIKGLGEQPYVWTDSDYEIQQLEDWKAHKKMLENLPSVTPQEPRWIPVSERLPKAEYGESDSVLVCFETETQDVLYFNGGNWCYPTGETYISVNHKNGWHNKVIAWMPLPQPYREVENDNG